MTVEQQPRVQPRVKVDLPGKKSGGKSLVFVGAGVLVLLLLVVGVGGFFALNWMKNKPGDDPTNGKGSTGTGTATAAPKELGRYWLAVNTTNKSDAIRAGDLVTMKSGQEFKFHFRPSENGYLYIVGPGQNNAPTAFLTAKPAAKSGLTTNEVKSGVDFSFPKDSETDYHWATLDPKPGTESYTLVFSPQPLSSPAFFNSEATGTPLTETEQAELNAFLLKYQTGGSATEVNTQDAAAPFVIVKAPKSTDPKETGRPVVFEVKIQHK